MTYPREKKFHVHYAHEIFHAREKKTYPQNIVNNLKSSIKQIVYGRKIPLVLIIIIIITNLRKKFDALKNAGEKCKNSTQFAVK